MTLSNDFGAPLSTSTKPSPAANARTLLPPPSTTVIRSVRRRTPPCPTEPWRRPADACCAPGTPADIHAAHAPTAPFSTSLRFSDTPSPSNVRDRSGAVAELVAFHADLLQQRQMEIGDRRAFRQHQVLAARPQPAGAAADNDVRLRVVVVAVAVAHVRSVHEHRVIEQRTLTVRRLGHLRDEGRKLLEVPGLDLRELLDPRQIVGVV